MANIKEYRISSDMDISGLSSNYFHTTSVRAQRLPFYLESCGHYYANDCYFTEREGLRSYLIILTLNGCGYVRAKDKEILIARNRAAIIDCMDFQFYQTASDSEWEFMWIHFYGSAASLYCELLNENGIELVNFGEDDMPRIMIGEIFDMLKNRHKNLDLELSEKLTGVITKMLLAKQTISSTPRFEQHRQDIMETLSVIKERYSERLSIDELSKHAHISKFYFVRIFKDFTGLTPYEYLMSYRINESKIFLFKTNMSITEVSNRCGFIDTSNYIRYFKRSTGTTPNTFRKDKSFMI